jgi:hypothetical protein
MRVVLFLVALAGVSASAFAAEPVLCAASGRESLRTADQVLADVAAAGCEAGTRLDAALTVAGQAIILQQSGICVADSVKTRTVTLADGSKALGFRCDLAAR